MDSYPLALKIISDCWGLFCVIWLIAAFWTKQNALFLGMVPFAYAVFAGRWRELKRPALWISAALFGASVVALALLSAAFGISGNHDWPKFRLLAILGHNIPYYVEVLRLEFGLAPMLLMLIAVIAAVRYRENVPYLAWAACVFVLALLLPPYDLRYVFLGYPALITVVCSVLFHASKRLLPQRFVWTPLAALAALSVIAHLGTKPPACSRRRGQAGFCTAGGRTETSLSRCARSIRS